MFGFGRSMRDADRYVMRFEPLASMESDAVVALLAPALQRSLTGRLPEGVG